MDQKGLPVHGYQPQSEQNIKLVNDMKMNEEHLLRQLDGLAQMMDIDGRWLAIGRTHIEQAFMAINRSIFKPKRINL